MLEVFDVGLHTLLDRNFFVSSQLVTPWSDISMLESEESHIRKVRFYVSSFLVLVTGSSLL